MIFTEEINELYEKTAILQEYLEDNEGDDAPIYAIACMIMRDIEEIKKRRSYPVFLEIKMESKESQA